MFFFFLKLSARRFFFVFTIEWLSLVVWNGRYKVEILLQFYIFTKILFSGSFTISQKHFYNKNQCVLSPVMITPEKFVPLLWDTPIFPYFLYHLGYINLNIFLNTNYMNYKNMDRIHKLELPHFLLRHQILSWIDRKEAYTFFRRKYVVWYA